MEQVSQTCTVEVERGLHARTATQLMQLCCNYQSDIEISNHIGIAKADSILQVLSICAGYQSSVTVTARGQDAKQANKAVLDFLKSK
jgi:phosphocarrier protein HPr